MEDQKRKKGIVTQASKDTGLHRNTVAKAIYGNAMSIISARKLQAVFGMRLYFWCSDVPTADREKIFIEHYMGDNR